jgi:Cdc6-like AAA superfamily ATPase
MLTIKLGKQREEIHRWLSAPDPSSNHTRACYSRLAATGAWFLRSEAFTRWRNQSSLIWLHGKAGCGKTVLSSTIITEIQKTLPTSKMAIAYFYFDFNNIDKQKPDNMIRSLIAQLSGQSTKPFRRLESLFSSCGNGERQPDMENLMEVLKDIIECLDETSIVLDALDECSEREELFKRISEVQTWKPQQFHLLVTSRRLPDIEEALAPLTNSQDRVCIQSKVVDADILAYVNERLQNDQRLSRWRNKPQVQEEIRSQLMEKADGM